MKKIILSVLVLWAAGAYSQEIKMPAEKRQEYVNDKATNSNDAQTQKRDDEARRRRAEAEKKRLSAEREGSIQRGEVKSSNSIYCMIREKGKMESKEADVEIITDSEFMRTAKQLGERDKRQAEALFMAADAKAYRSGMDALNSFSRSGWSLVNSNVYTQEEMVVHEYLMEYQLR